MSQACRKLGPCIKVVPCKSPQQGQLVILQIQDHQFLNVYKNEEHKIWNHLKPIASTYNPLRILFCASDRCMYGGNGCLFSCKQNKYLSRTVQFNYLNYHYTYSTKNYKLMGILPEYSNCCLALKPDRVTFMTSLIFDASMLQTLTSSSGVLVSLFIGRRETKDISGVH